MLNISFFLVLTIQFSLLFDIKVASHMVRTICGLVVATDIAKKGVIICSGCNYTTRSCELGEGAQAGVDRVEEEWSSGQ